MHLSHFTKFYFTFWVTIFIAAGSIATTTTTTTTTSIGLHIRAHVHTKGEVMRDSEQGYPGKQNPKHSPRVHIHLVE